MEPPPHTPVHPSPARGVLRATATDRPTRRTLAAISALLCLATLLVYLPLRHADFLNYDDDIHVTANPSVQAGLTWDGLRWAATSTPRWMPLTWLSHMLDCQLFGVHPGAHHLSSVALHMVNSVLLLSVLFRLTGALWPSAFVAALFALHPLQVEPVAWISARPHLVSTLCWLTALLAYVRYTEQPTWRRFLPVGLCLLLGLLAKRMVVALPLTLLLLDNWPLRRRQAFWNLLREKIPLLLIAGAGVALEMVILYRAGGLSPLAEVPLVPRVTNALIGFAVYAGRIVWPAHLATPYPSPHQVPPLWQILGAILGLIAASAAVVRFGRQRRYLLTGWGWYLVTLLPVIGLVQSEGQTVADRYTYVPLVGLAIIAAWAAADARRARPGLRPILAVAAGAVLLACACRSSRQVGYWHDSLTLFEHALAVTSANPVAENNFGTALRDAGRRDEARRHFAAALQHQPAGAYAHINMASMLLEDGDAAAAEAHARQALQASPGSWAARLDLGMARLLQGDPAEAREHLSAVVALQPRNALAHFGLAQAFEGEGRLREALAEYERAAPLDPRLPAVHYRLGVALEAAGRPAEAVLAYRAELRENPANAFAENNLGAALQATGQREEARAHFAAAVQLDPSNAEAQNNLGVALAERGDVAAAEEHVRQALRLRPDYVSARVNLGLLRAQQGDPAGAADEFRAVLAQDPANAEARARLAEIDEEP